MEEAPVPIVPSSVEQPVEAQTTSLQEFDSWGQQVARISAQPRGSEPLHSSPFLLLFPIRIVSEVLRTIESALVEGNRRLATTLPHWPGIPSKEKRLCLVMKMDLFLA